MKSILAKFRSLTRYQMLGLLAGLVFVLMSLTSVAADLLTDYWWFRSIDFSSVFTSVLSTQLVLALVFSSVATLIFWLTFSAVDRITPEVNSVVTQDFIVERFIEVFGEKKRQLRLGLSIFLGLVAGLRAGGEWQTWMLYRNGGSWGVSDPILDTDAGFYVFDLPFYTFVNDWLSAVLLVALIATIGLYFFNGTFNPILRRLLDSATSSVKMHVSILAAALAATRAVSYFLDRYELVYSDNGGFRGVMTTDFTINLPGLWLMVLIALVSAGFLLVNARRKGWGFAVIALGLWGLSHVIILGALPSIYQRLRVDPERTTKEAAFVDHNIEFTRIAFGLDNIVERNFDYEPGLSADNSAQAEQVFRSVPLVDPGRADDEFNSNQTIRGFFSFDGPLDVDRYLIDGVSTPVVLGARNLDLLGVPGGWEDQTIVNTHGYGVAIAAANEHETEGVGLETSQPLDYQISGLGVEETVVDPDFPQDYSERPQVYYSEGLQGYAIVGADRAEVDYQSSDNVSVETRYAGSGGVPIDSLFSRLMFAVRFDQLDPLISGAMTDESKVLMNRNIETRVRLAAPFLSVDSDPYPVVSEGKIYWIVDAYTTTNDFPYAAVADTSLGIDSDLQSGYNYVRNSVKVVVDAFEGSVDLYEFDSQDPMLKAWSASFPGVIQPQADFPEALVPHIRYPTDLFTAQTDMWTKYVIDNPQVFIQGDTSWSVATEPSTQPVGEEEAVEADVTSIAMPARYTFNQVPDAPDQAESEPESEFVIQRYFAPRNTDGDRAKHLTAVMMGRSDGDNYGELVLVNVPSGEVQTPDIVDTEIRKLASLTEYKKQRQGNKVDFGEIHLVFAGSNVIYVRPVYAESGGSGNIPELVRVVASTGDTKRAMGSTLEDALDLLAGAEEGATEVDVTDVADETVDTDVESDPPEQLGTDTEESPTTEFVQPTSLSEALTQIEELLAAADAASSAGDEELAGELRDQLDLAIAAANDLIGG